MNNSEKIDAIIKEVATINEQIKNARREIERIDNSVKEIERKLWNLMMAVVVAMLGLIGGLILLVIRRQ